jgi:hypothetical protein
MFPSRSEVAANASGANRHTSGAKDAAINWRLFISVAFTAGVCFGTIQYHAIRYMVPYGTKSREKDAVEASENESARGGSRRG